MAKRNIVVLGSTGSIGINTLKVVERFPERFRVVALSAFNNVDTLCAQIKTFRPRRVALSKDKIALLKDRIRVPGLEVLEVGEASQLVQARDVDVVVLGIQGSAALGPFLEAVRCGKIVAPANKEALVMAGGIIMREAKRQGAKIIPVDSEQSAIFQCLEGRAQNPVKKIYLTASGGSLKDVAKKDFDKVSIGRILRHPRWKMGKKITVDSASLMNKGLEVIEAMWLFGLSADKIEVLIHPESVVHSMVEFADGAVIAQLGATDMRIPIQYALTYPERLETGLEPMDLVRQRTLTFAKPDRTKFPSLELCYDVARKGQTFGSVLNAANEEAVEAFLKGRIGFSKIYEVASRVVGRHKPPPRAELTEILAADFWARGEAREIIGN